MHGHYMCGVTFPFLSPERCCLSLHAQHAAGAVHASARNLLAPNTEVVSGVHAPYQGILSTPPWMSLPVFAVSSNKTQVNQKSVSHQLMQRSQQRGACVGDSWHPPSLWVARAGPPCNSHMCRLANSRSLNVTACNCSGIKKCALPRKALAMTY